MTDTLPLFLVVPPGLEAPALAEARDLGFPNAEAMTGGITLDGTWADAARLNRQTRCVTRILVRVARFRAMHLAQLDKRARKVDWSMIPPGTEITVEATCRKSKIYHDRAAAQRIATALVDQAGAIVSKDAQLRIKARIEDDLCVISIDTSGAALHMRGHKQAVGKAPIRETMAAAMLRMCGYDGTVPLVDPMCGSGTFPIEAAEIALGLLPGRSRGFAMDALDLPAANVATPLPSSTQPMFYGFDRDTGAIRSATKNANTAGVADLCQFSQQPVSDLAPPDGPKGLIMVNPPYGARIGNRKLLFGLYGSLGKIVQDRFAGWAFGMVTSDPGLAKATGLNLQISDPIAHGSLRVALYQAQL